MWQCKGGIHVRWSTGSWTGGQWPCTWAGTVRRPANVQQLTAWTACGPCSWWQAQVGTHHRTAFTWWLAALHTLHTCCDHSNPLTASQLVDCKFHKSNFHWSSKPNFLSHFGWTLPQIDQSTNRPQWCNMNGTVQKSCMSRAHNNCIYKKTEI